MSTEEQLLLSVAIASGVSALAAIAVVTFTVLGHRRETWWRRKDLTRDVVERWNREISVPAPQDVMRYEERSSRPQVESDLKFPEAIRLLSWRENRCYHGYKSAINEYFASCRALRNGIRSEVENQSGLHQEDPAGSGSGLTALGSLFVSSLYEQAVKDGDHRLSGDDVIYTIKATKYSGPDGSGQVVMLDGNATKNGMPIIDGHLVRVAVLSGDVKLAENQIADVEALHRRMLHNIGRSFMADEVREANRLRYLGQQKADEMHEILLRLQLR